MVEFPLHTLDSAPEASRQILVQAQKDRGAPPNMYRTLAEAPAALGAYEQVRQAFSESSLSALERQVVYLTAAHKNRCHYCTRQDAAFGDESERARQVAEAIRGDRPIGDSRLQALRVFTAAVTEQRGWVSDQATAAFLAAGYERAHVLEVVIGIGLVTISAYANHLAATPLDTAAEGGRLAS